MFCLIVKLNLSYSSAKIKNFHEPSQLIVKPHPGKLVRYLVLIACC